jgi:histone deacetylase complex regulatory component SIN3
VKQEMTKLWKKIFEQNYPRSLDHRSFYFKQQVRCNAVTVIVEAGLKLEKVNH